MHRIVISCAIATTAISSVVFTGMWLPTPSYNTLSFQALLVVAIGLIMADKCTSYTSVIGWFFIGLGGWLAFMAKPTTAIVLGMCVAFYLLFAGKINIRLLVISIVTAIGLTILSAFTIDGSIVSFVNRIKDGADAYNILYAGKHAKLLRLDDFQLSATSRFIFIMCSVVVFLVSYFLQSSKKILIYNAILLSIIFGLVSIIISLGVIHKIIYREYCNAPH